MREDVFPGDQKSAMNETCGVTSLNVAMVSTRRASEVFDLARQDNLLAQAILHFERAASRGALADTGAFSFAIAQGDVEVAEIRSGRILVDNPKRAPTTGFAEYSASIASTGSMSVTMRVWELAYPEVLPRNGMTAFLTYQTNGQSITLADARTHPAVPEIGAEYVYTRSSREADLVGGISRVR